MSPIIKLWQIHTTNPAGVANFFRDVPGLALVGVHALADKKEAPDIPDKALLLLRFWNILVISRKAFVFSQSFRPVGGH
jgi:hypothetical protein